MRFLRGGQLHARHNGDPGLPAHLNGSGSIARRVVIRQRDDIVSQKRRHVDKVIGRHIVAAARGQARMEVQIIPELPHHYNSSAIRQARP